MWQPPRAAYRIELYTFRGGICSANRRREHGENGVVELSSEDEAKGPDDKPSSGFLAPGSFVNCNKIHREDSWREMGESRRFQEHLPSRHRYKPPTAGQPSTELERSMSDRMMTMENMLRRVAGLQQAQLECLTLLTERPAYDKTSEEPKDEKKKRESPSTDSCRDDPFSYPDSVGTDDDYFEWREYHGAEIWCKEKELKRRNPAQR